MAVTTPTATPTVFSVAALRRLLLTARETSQPKGLLSEPTGNSLLLLIIACLDIYVKYSFYFKKSQVTQNLITAAVSQA
jgi:hypothetical protein